MTRIGLQPSFDRGGIFGEMAFLDPGPRSADAVSDAETHVFRLSRSDFDAVASADPDLGRRVFSRLAILLAVRLRQTDQALRNAQEA